MTFFILTCLIHRLLTLYGCLSWLGAPNGKDARKRVKYGWSTWINWGWFRNEIRFIINWIIWHSSNLFFLLCIIGRRFRFDDTFHIIYHKLLTLMLQRFDVIKVRFENEEIRNLHLITNLADSLIYTTLNTIRFEVFFSKESQVRTIFAAWAECIILFINDSDKCWHSLFLSNDSTFFNQAHAIWWAWSCLSK